MLASTMKKGHTNKYSQEGKLRLKGTLHGLAKLSLHSFPENKETT